MMSPRLQLLHSKKKETWSVSTSLQSGQNFVTERGLEQQLHIRVHTRTSLLTSGGQTFHTVGIQNATNCTKIPI